MGSDGDGEYIDECGIFFILADEGDGVGEPRDGLEERCHPLWSFVGRFSAEGSEEDTEVDEEYGKGGDAGDV